MSHYHEMLGVLPNGISEMLRRLGLSGWPRWDLALALGLAWLLVLAWILFLRTHIRYGIGSKHLKILLFGIPIRWIRLDNIRHIHGRKTSFAERWGNMVFTRHDRLLVIEKHHGLFKRCLITPDKRYVFKAELERAIRARLSAKQGLPATEPPSDTTVVVNLNFEESPEMAASQPGR